MLRWIQSTTWFTSLLSSNTRVRVLNRTSNIITVLVSGRREADSNGIGVDPINNLVYFTDYTNNVVYSVCTNNTAVTNKFAGIRGSAGYGGDYGDASLLVAGLQTFVAFSIPVALPAGVASEIWLQDVHDNFSVICNSLCWWITISGLDSRFDNINHDTAHCEYQLYSCTLC
jgi:hypothetical protein